MKRNNKKGFTIVELVIVIAVIAILAGVLIPTFSGIIDKANESAAVQRASAAYKEAVALALANGNITANETQPSDGFIFTFATAGSTDATATTRPEGFKYTTVTVTDGKVTVSK